MAARRKTEPKPAASEALEPEALPADWQTRHPARTYPDETPQLHAARLRALAAGVPAKRERFLALADELERSGSAYVEKFRG